MEERRPSKNFGSRKYAKVREKSRKKRRALFRFDLSPVPHGATIQSATLYLRAARTSKQTIYLHRILDPWTEKGATWNNMADRYDPAATTSFVAPKKRKYVAVEITSLVQAWVNGDLPNYGFMLIAEPSKGSKFNTREAGSKKHPYLEIVYVESGAGSPTGPVGQSPTVTEHALYLPLLAGGAGN